MWRRFTWMFIGTLVMSSVSLPTYASAHPYHYSLQRGPNQYSPATPQEWQEHVRHSQVDPTHFGAQIKYVGEFDRTSNTIDLSKYSPDEIYYGCVSGLHNVTRKTKVIVLPYTTLIKTKEFPAPTAKDKLMDFYGGLYARTITQWNMKHS